MAFENDTSASAADEATEWLIRVRENPENDEVRDAFNAWIFASAENRREWEKTCQAWRAVGVARTSRSRVASGQRGRTNSHGAKSKIATAFATAGLALCLIAFAGPSMLIRMQADYQTGTGQTRSVDLADGSRVILGPDSALLLAFSDSRRGVVLLKGQAFFDIARDENKPFEVDGGGLTIAVLGTGFDLDLGENRSVVALAHGSIEASSLSGQRVLAPGDVLTLDRHTGGISEAKVDVADIGAWREGRLAVVNQPIGAVIAEIQRYHPAWISVPDQSLADQKVTGIYDLKAPDEALGALVDPYGGKVRKISAYLRIVSRF
ncbi:DUF4880 domain-containing protein [Rhizobiales bacterium RZME27]|uniref:DUF4880 domain-containing protein n=1 Tax=Endobacterium cereale TaxID=2663029 RepID=A0A6A8A831_9HYPH|nr:FecR family protein [Endobacterium cereale]MEB2844288.1 FecR family protein [Endobacterium cereale]MQY46879.1 DUF4880 domain-containing protein [Endobacterium cereale]